MFLDLNAIHETHNAIQNTSSELANHSNIDTTSILDTKPASNPDNQAARAGCYIGAGLAMTGALGVGFGQGYVGGKAALAVAKNPDEYSKIRAMMLVGAAIAESSAIYALIIAILLIFVAPSL